MTDQGPPLCHWPGCNRHVKRAWGRENSGLLGRREIDGKRWRWFCGPKHWARWRAEHDPKFPQQAAKATRTNQQRIRQRVLKRLVAACRPLMDEHGKVEAKALVEVMYREIRRERLRVNEAVYKQRRRALMSDEQAWKGVGTWQA